VFSGGSRFRLSGARWSDCAEALKSAVEYKSGTNTHPDALMAKKITKRKPTQVYAFIDTNIFLDFYRHRNDATLKMLDRLKPVRDRLLCTYQVEMEFLKNRQRVLLDAYQEVGKPVEPKLPSIFADSATSGSLKTVTKTAAKKTHIVKK
jgi:hypothetical protein